MKEFFKRHEDGIGILCYVIFLVLYGALLNHLNYLGVEFPDIPGGL